MDAHWQIHWGRVVVAALLSEVVVVAVLSSVIVTYRFLVSPGRSAAEYQAFNDRASYYVAPTTAGLAVFLCALWATRRMTSDFVVNGTLIGVLAVVLTVGFLFGAKPEHRFMYGVSFALRIVGGVLGGLAARYLA